MSLGIVDDQRDASMVSKFELDKSRSLRVDEPLINVEIK